jgi:solute carrier family 35 protein C2
MSSSSTSGQKENQDKTHALIITCSFMLSIALLLRLCMAYFKRLHQKGIVNTRVLYVFQVSTQFCVHVFDISVYIILWYAISIGMTLFNKWFLRIWANGGYPFSSTMTCINMFTKYFLSRIMNCFTKKKISPLSHKTLWKLAVPIGLCTSLDIMFSNLSFFYITVTFYTIVKSGGNVWNLLFSICLGHQRPSFRLFTVIVLISSGIALASYGSIQSFNYYGFFLVVLASMIGTLKWVLMQSLLKEMEQGSHRILAVVYYISPASAVGLLPIVLATEAKNMIESKFIQDTHLLLLSIVLILICGCLAFVLIFVEIILVNKTSALSLGIAGSFKDVTQVLLAVLIFGDRLNPVNVFGLVIATSGMLLYTFFKYSGPQLREPSASSAHQAKYEKLSVADDDHTIGSIQEDLEDGMAEEEKNGSVMRHPSQHLHHHQHHQMSRRESRDFDAPLHQQKYGHPHHQNGHHLSE